MASELPSSPAAASLPASRIMALSRMAVPNLVSPEYRIRSHAGCVRTAEPITLAGELKATAPGRKTCLTDPDFSDLCPACPARSASNRDPGAEGPHWLP